MPLAAEVPVPSDLKHKVFCVDPADFPRVKVEPGVEPMSVCISWIDSTSVYYAQPKACEAHLTQLSVLMNLYYAYGIDQLKAKFPNSRIMSLLPERSARRLTLGEIAQGTTRVLIQQDEQKEEQTMTTASGGTASGDCNVSRVYCAARFIDNCLYRARLDRMTGVDAVRVFFVDYGNEADVKLKDLYALPRHFRLMPNVAVKCRFEGVFNPGVQLDDLRENLVGCSANLTISAPADAENAVSGELTRMTLLGGFGSVIDQINHRYANDDDGQVP